MKNILRIYRYLQHIKNRVMSINTSPSSLILLYHRVASTQDDPHLLSVSPDNFRVQLMYLKRKYKIIRLSELTKKITRNSMVITFDDGYADNLHYALPILKELNIPATIFITAGKIDSNDPFYWDRSTDKKDQGRALSKDELIKLSREPLIEIGAHTMTHPHLSAETIEKQEYEIKESKEVIEDIIKKPVDSFAYPFGGENEFNNKTVDIVKNSGYKYACANIPGRVNKKSNIFTINRRIVRNWDIKQFKKKLQIF